MKSNEIVLKVAAGSQIDRVGSAAIRFIREGKDVRLLAMGAGAVNQAIKAAIKARGFAAPSGVDLVIKPGFVDVEVDGKTKSAISLELVVG